MDADVIVLGGGLAGVAVAAALARVGVDVVRVDPPRAGVGPSVGLLDLGVVELPHRTVAALGAERASALFRFARRGRDRWTELGQVTGAAGLWVAMAAPEAEELRAARDATEAAGHRAAVWDAEAVAATLGAPLGPALHLAGDATIDPARAMAALQVGVRAACGEARFVWGTTDRVRVEVDGEPLDAELAIVAAGAASAALDPALEGALVPIREQQLLARVDRPLGAGRAGHGWTAWSTRPTGELLLAGCRWASPHLEVGEGEPGIVHGVQARLDAFLDRLGVEREVIARSASRCVTTRDGLPLIGPLPGDPRRWVCAGFGTSPWAMVAAAADALARAAVGEPAEVPDALVSRRLVRWRRG